MQLFVANVKVTTETDSGKIKKVKEVYLVNAQDITEVVDQVKEEMRGRIETWELDRVHKSNITDILNYSGLNKVTKSTVAEIDLS